MNKRWRQTDRIGKEAKVSEKELLELLDSE